MRNFCIQKFEKRFSKKSNLIFDFDDSIWLPNVSNANKKFDWLKNGNKIKKIIFYSKLVIAGNEYLKQFAINYNKNVIIIPTTIDTEEYKKIPLKNRKITIGWSGSITTIQHFEYALGFLKKIKEKYKDIVEIKVIGDDNYVNNELDELTDFLEKAVSVLKKNGRPTVITFHSLEDRIVKEFFKEKTKDCVCPPEYPVCVCNTVPELKIITRKPIVPSEDEIKRNKRARSA